MTLLYRRLRLLLAHLLLQPDSLLRLSNWNIERNRKGLKTCLFPLFDSCWHSCVRVCSQIVSHLVNSLSAYFLRLFLFWPETFHQSTVCKHAPDAQGQCTSRNSQILAKRNTHIVSECCVWIIDGISLLKNASPTFLSHREETVISVPIWEETQANDQLGKHSRLHTVVGINVLFIYNRIWITNMWKKQTDNLLELKWITRSSWNSFKVEKRYEDLAHLTEVALCQAEYGSLCWINQRTWEDMAWEWQLFKCCTENQFTWKVKLSVCHTCLISLKIFDWCSFFPKKFKPDIGTQCEKNPHIFINSVLSFFFQWTLTHFHLFLLYCC